MPNTALLTRQQLESLDATVYSPKSATLMGRSLFTSYKIPDAARSYRYKVMTTSGQAKILANRGTDIPLVDGDAKDSTQNVIDFALAASYSNKELAQAQAAGLDLAAMQGAAVARGMSDFEDKLIFNGNSDYGIPGLVNIPGAQNATMEKTFATNDPKSIMADLKTAKEMITHLVGYENVKPVLVLPAAQYDALDVAYNDYQPTTILELLANRGWFSKIVVANELQGANNIEQKDMGLIFDPSPQTMQILDAQYLKREPVEYSKMTTYVPYTESMGGIICRYPKALVQLTSI